MGSHIQFNALRTNIFQHLHKVSAEGAVALGTGHPTLCGIRALTPDVILTSVVFVVHGVHAGGVVDAAVVALGIHSEGCSVILVYVQRAELPAVRKSISRSKTMSR